MNSRQPSVNGHGPAPIPRPQPVIAQPAPAATPRSAGDVVSGFAKLLQLGDSSGVTGTYVAARLREFAVPRRFPSRVITALLGATMVAAGAATFAAFLGGGFTILFGQLITPGAAQVYNLWGTALVATSIPLLVLSLGTHALWQGRCSREAACLPVPESSQIRMVLQELRSVHDESAAAVKAKNEYGQALIGHATTIQNLEIEQAKLDSQLGQSRREEELEQAQHRTALVEEDQRRRHAELESVLHREVDAARERLREESEASVSEVRAEAANEIARSAETAATQVAAAKSEAEAAVLRARREAALARGTTSSAVEAARQLTKRLAEVERMNEDLQRECDEQTDNNEALQEKLKGLEHEIDALQKQVKAADESAALFEATRRRQVEEEQHRRERAQLRAETAGHRLEAKQLRNEQRVSDELTKRRMADVRDPSAARRRRAKLEEQRSLQRIREGLLTFTATTDRIAYAQRGVDAYLKRIDDEHGEDSAEHYAAVAVAEDFMRTVRDEEDA